MRKESINLRNYCSFKTFLNISRLQKYTKNVICLCGQMFSHVASHKMSLKCLIFIHFIRKVGWFSMQLFRWILDFSQLFLYFSIFLCSYALKNSCMNFDWNIFNNSKIALVFKFEMEMQTLDISKKNILISILSKVLLEKLSSFQTFSAI